MKKLSPTQIASGILLLILLLIIGTFLINSRIQQNIPEPSPKPNITANTAPSQSKLPKVTSIQYPINNPEETKTTVLVAQAGLHPGIDFLVPAGTEVKATAAGKVRAVGFRHPYGYRIVIDHEINGQLITTMYGNLNLDTIKAKALTEVNAGDVLGLTADLTPKTSHLHYEVRTVGGNINPTDWLKQNVTD